MSATDVTQTQVGIVGAGPAGCDGYHGVCRPAVPDDDGDGFMASRQRAQLEYVCSSRAAATSLAERYVGVKHVGEGQIV